MNRYIKTFLALAISASISSLGILPASAAASVTTQPDFSVSGNSVTIDQASAWDEGTTVDLFYACPISFPDLSAQTSPARLNLPSGLATCSLIYTDNTLATPFSGGDLRDSFLVENGVTAKFVELNRLKLVMVSKNTDTSSAVSYVHTSSRLFTPSLGTVTMPILAISGTQLNITDGSFSTYATRSIVVSCQIEIATAQTTPQLFNGGVASCVGLYTTATSDASPANNIPATDLSAAYASTGPTRDPYDPDMHGRHIVVVEYAHGTNSYAVAIASVEFTGSISSGATEAAPYTGPVVQAPGISSPKRAGEKLTLSGSNLSGVSKVEIAGLDCQVVVNSAGEIEIVVPTGLAAGTYDLVITSDSGKLTVQDAVVVSGSLAASAGEVSAGTKRTDESVRIVAMDVVGAGKVQIFFNGKEIAWVNAADSTDPKLRSADGVPYLVRTVDLVSGMKNVVEIHVDGVRVKRAAYTG